MRVRTLREIGEYPPGTVMEMLDGIARQWIDRGWAEPESAALAAPENAMLPRPAARAGSNQR